MKGPALSHTMSYLTNVLRPDEQVLAEGKLHWITYYPAIAWLVIGVILLFSYGTAEPGALHVVRYLVRQRVQMGLAKLDHAGVSLFVFCAYIALLYALRLGGGPLKSLLPTVV